MTPEQITTYLTQWMNKAVQNGGFSAQEAHDGLQALSALSGMAKGNEETQEHPAKPPKGKK